MVAFDSGCIQLVEVVDAELPVRAAGAQDVVDHDQQAVRHGDNRLLAPPTPSDAPELRMEVAGLGADAGPGDLPRIALSQTLPRLTGPFSRLPALCLLLGHTPAHEARCPALGQRPISVPISARMAAAAIALIPGIVCSNATASANGAKQRSISACT